MLTLCCRETGAPGSAVCTHEEAAGCTERSRQVQAPESKGARDAFPRPWSQKMTLGTLRTSDSTSTTSDNAGSGLLTRSSMDDRQQLGPCAGLQRGHALPPASLATQAKQANLLASGGTTLCWLCLEDDAGHPAATQQQGHVCSTPHSPAQEHLCKIFLLKHLQLPFQFPAQQHSPVGLSQSQHSCHSFHAYYWSLESSSRGRGRRWCTPGLDKQEVRAGRRWSASHCTQVPHICVHL